ncbi:MAG: amidophosphoribosyltransferase [Luteibaculaceae bacterium]
MSDAIKHECGIALLRLKKDLSYYQDKYGTALYGINKLYLLMEKQHNRGQDGAGVVNIKFDAKPGTRYISRSRSAGGKPIQEVFDHINSRFKKLQATEPEKLKDTAYLKENEAFVGELYLGHLRYGTFGKNSIESCHPFLRQNNWMTRNLVVAGNFNLTNVDELFGLLVNLGQHPKEVSDTVTVLEKIGHFLDVENERLFQKFKHLGYTNKEITQKIAEQLNIAQILKNAAEDWDGGYTMAGLIGHGDAFVLRDPNGIRPAYYYEDDEIAVVTSEKPVIRTAFNIQTDNIKELTPGHAIIIKKDGNLSVEQILPEKPRFACSFERIYFARGNDKEIYRERKELGRLMVPQILKAIDYDVDNTVFSFIPNTAESAFYGMVKGIEDHIDTIKYKELEQIRDNFNQERVIEILSRRPRVEKIAIKDAKLRTFITDDDNRDDLVAHVYDITYGTVNKHKDNLVVIDDSIVRGTTLKQSIFKILDRLQPKKIIIASSAPQIRFPDCYGIDMAKMGDFIAFQAAIALLKEHKMEHILTQVYEDCKAQLKLPKEKIVNVVKKVYEPFTYEQVSNKIAALLKPEGLNSETEIVFQSIENLHQACPNNLGDWYFSGNYPTPGGNKVVCKAFINFYEGRNERAY